MLLLTLLLLPLFVSVGSIEDPKILLQGFQSFARRGVGFRYISQLSSGSAGNHRLIFHLNIVKLKQTLTDLREQIDSVTTDVHSSGLRVEKEMLLTDSTSVKGFYRMKEIDPDNHKEFLNNTQLFENEFKERLMSKRKVFLSEIIIMEELIQNLDYVLENNRNKRSSTSLLPIIGSVAEILFGISSSNTVDKLSDKLDDLASRQIKISKFMTASASVISELEMSLNDLRNETYSQINESFVNFKQDITENVIKLSSSLALQVVRIQNSVERVSAEVTSQLANFRFKLEQLLRGLLLALNGGFPVGVIPPSKLIAYLKVVEDSLPMGIALAIVDFKSDSVLETLQNTNCNLESDTVNLLLICNLPLTKVQENFNLYRVFQAPAAIKNMTTSIGKQVYSEVENIGSPYLGVGPDGMSFVLLEDEMMDACFHASNRIVCKSHFIVYKSASAISCPYAIFTNNLNLEKEICRYSITTLDTLFVHPLSEDVYYFAGDGLGHTLTVRCPQTNTNNRTNYYQLNVTTSLVTTIPRHCSIISEFFTIYEEFFSSSFYEIEIPQPNLTLNFYSVSSDEVLQRIAINSKDIVKRMENKALENIKWKTGKTGMSIPLNDLLEIGSVDETKNRVNELKGISYGLLILFFGLILALLFFGWKLKQLWDRTVNRSPDDRLEIIPMVEEEEV